MLAAVHVDDGGTAAVSGLRAPVGSCGSGPWDRHPASFLHGKHGEEDPRRDRRFVRCISSHLRWHFSGSAELLGRRGRNGGNRFPVTISSTGPTSSPITPSPSMRRLGRSGRGCCRWDGNAGAGTHRGLWTCCCSLPTSLRPSGSTRNGKGSLLETPCRTGHPRVSATSSSASSSPADTSYCTRVRTFRQSSVTVSVPGCPGRGCSSCVSSKAAAPGSTSGPEAGLALFGSPPGTRCCSSPPTSSWGDRC